MDKFLQIKHQSLITTRQDHFDLVYVLVAIIKKRLNLPQSLYTILQVLSVTTFEKEPLLQILNNNDYNLDDPGTDNQLKLFH